MKRFVKACLVLGCWASLVSSIAVAQDDTVAERLRKAKTMASRIDALLAERWKVEDVSPAPLADDAEFMRRVYLDLTGVIPTVAQARKFLNDTSEGKREKLIEQLLKSPTHATHLASTWRNIMLPNGFDAGQLNNAVGLQNWLRAQFVDNLRYDRLVGDFLVSGGGSEIGPALFYTSQDLEPEKLAASTARIFLGLQIECAQCHDHPFDRWTKKDFWGYAAFFAQLDQTSQNRGAMNRTILVDSDSGDVKLPDTETVVAPKYPGSEQANDELGGTRREQLAVWMASRDNPYLARAGVNRIWAQMFGRGIVDPVDDLSEQNPPSHPALFKELSDYFSQEGFDLRQLYRTLANTRVYQLSSRNPEGKDTPPELFARMAIKPMSAEQLYDSLNRSLGRRPRGNMRGTPINNLLVDPARLAFIGKMQASSRSATEYQAGIPQALTLLNGTDVATATNPTEGSLLASLEAPFFNDEDRVETLFMATFSREPRDRERSQFTEYLKDSKDRKQALSDILWALLNGAEFALNH